LLSSVPSESDSYPRFAPAASTREEVDRPFRHKAHQLETAFLALSQSRMESHFHPSLGSRFGIRSCAEPGHKRDGLPTLPGQTIEQYSFLHSPEDQCACGSSRTKAPTKQILRHR